MNCQRDHGARPPSAVMVRISPTRFTKESRKTRKRPRKALPDRCFAVVSPRGCGSLVSPFRSLAGNAHSYPLRARRIRDCPARRFFRVNGAGFAENGAAQESKLRSVGLPRLTGLED